MNCHLCKNESNLLCCNKLKKIFPAKILSSKYFQNRKSWNSWWYNGPQNEKVYELWKRGKSCYLELIDFHVSIKFQFEESHNEKNLSIKMENGISQQNKVNKIKSFFLYYLTHWKVTEFSKCCLRCLKCLKWMLWICNSIGNLKLSLSH